MNKHFIVAALLIITAVLTTACGSLSLFSSRHVHYHGSEETDNKIDHLEKRLSTLEKAAKP